MQPIFIVVEGADGTGKSTLVRGIESWLRARGEQVCRTEEPSDNPIGLALRYMLTQPELPNGRTFALLFAADRSHHIEQVIQPALQEGMFVVCDRYDLSTMVYQMAQGMTGFAHEPPLERSASQVHFRSGFTWDKCVRWLRELHVSMLRPDVTLVLRGISPEAAMRRVAARKGAEATFEKLDFQRTVHALYERSGELIPSDEVCYLNISESDAPFEVLRSAKVAIDIARRRTGK
jgi:thymidylate kinase